jgi:tetratricopeptide (TPR) repeat protein/AAA+ ATPase superfamily predicted ATPase
MKIDPDKLPPPKDPFRGILPFRLVDWRIFFERDRETERLVNLISMYPGVLLYGRSGTGKSSLLNAAVVPEALRRRYAPERIRVFPDPDQALVIERLRLREEDKNISAGNDSPNFLPSRFTIADNDQSVRLSCERFLEVLRAPSENFGLPLLIFDQFEEYITLFEEAASNPERFEAAQQARRKIEQLLRELLLGDSLPSKIVFAFRDDYLARLTALFGRIPDLMDHGVRLVAPGIELLHYIVRGPFTPSQERGIAAGQFGGELSEELAQKIENGIRTSQPSGLLNLSEVQTICLALWRNPKLGEELLRTKDAPAVLRRIIESEARASLKEFRWWDRARAIAVLSNLVTEDGTRNVIPDQILVSQTRRNPLLWVFRGDWGKFLRRLPNTGLVRRSLSSGTTYYYELTSEFLIPQIQKWQQKLRRRRQVILALICGFLVALPWSLWLRAKRAEQIATTEKQAAIDVIKWMGSQLWTGLAGTGKVDLLQMVNDREMQYLNEHPPRPDDLDTQLVMGWATYQKGSLLQMKGNLQRARELYDRGLQIFDKFHADKLKDADYLYFASVTKGELASIYVGQNDLEAAAKVYGDELRIIKEIDQEYPNNPLVQNQLSFAYTGLGDVMYYQGKLNVCMENYNSSLSIYEKLTQDAPTDFFCQQRFANSCINVANVLAEQGYLKKALSYYERSLAVAEKFVSGSSKSPYWRRVVSMSKSGIASILQQQGQFEAARKMYAEGLEISQALADEDPENDWWESNLSYSLREVGRALSDEGHLHESYDYCRRSFLKAKDLSEKDAKNAYWQHSRSAIQQMIADVLRQDGKLKDALNASQESLFILQQLEKKAPSNAVWQGSLSTTEQEIGDILLEQGKPEAALISYQDALVARQKLVDVDDGNASRKNDLSESYDKIGKIFLQRGDFSAALTNFGHALTIREGLEKLASDNDNAVWRADLGYSYFHTGLAQSKIEPNSKQQAQAVMTKGQDILRNLKERNALTAEQQKWLDEVESELGKAEKTR